MPGGELFPADRDEDGGEEQHAGGAGAQIETAELFGLGQEIAQRRAEWAGEDVRDPEREHLPRADSVGDPGEQDEAAEDQRAVAEAQTERLGCQVTGGGAEGERGDFGQPVTSGRCRVGGVGESRFELSRSYRTSFS
jgi:hypothetical protein